MMLNQVMIVGRLTANPQLKDGESATELTVAVPRSYKNAEGEYETDFIDCVLWENVARNVCEYCKKGDIVGIRGRIQTMIDNPETGEKKQYVVAEKITFLSSKKAEEDEETTEEK